MEYVKFKNSEQTEFLRKVKNKSKKSWNKIAEAFNISQSSIIKYLSGKVKMPKNLFYKLCNQYKINSLQYDISILEINNQEKKLRYL